MIEVLRETGKRSAGWLLSRTSERYSYRNCIFILAHMRCGSTALANVLCSRREVSGYGEAHIRYDGQGALGRLALNQMRRDGWKPDSDFLFDKILHCRLDNAVPHEFFGSRAIFMVRPPDEAIPSIVNLFTRMSRRAYDTEEKAALYYVERLEALATLWRRFPPQRRIGITHEDLLRDPERALSLISKRLGFDPVLENRYVSLAASRKGGGGDPLVSGTRHRIEAGVRNFSGAAQRLNLPDELGTRVRRAHDRLINLFAHESTEILL